MMSLVSTWGQGSVSAECYRLSLQYSSENIPEDQWVGLPFPMIDEVPNSSSSSTKSRMLCSHATQATMVQPR